MGTIIYLSVARHVVTREICNEQLSQQIVLPRLTIVLLHKVQHLLNNNHLDTYNVL